MSRRLLCSLRPCWCRLRRGVWTPFPARLMKTGRLDPAKYSDSEQRTSQASVDPLWHQGHNVASVASRVPVYCQYSQCPAATEESPGRVDLTGSLDTSMVCLTVTNWAWAWCWSRPLVYHSAKQPHDGQFVPSTNVNITGPKLHSLASTDSSANTLYKLYNVMIFWCCSVI